MSKQQKNFWDEIWACDNGGDIWDHDFWKKASPEVVDLIQSESPESRPNVLDLGCGLGRNAVAFAQAGFTVTATDFSPAAVAHLKTWSEKLDLQIRTFVADFVDDDFPPRTFDIVLSLGVIYHGHRDQATSAITNIRNWLKKGGLFYFSFPTRQDGDYGRGKKLADHTFEFQPGHVHYHADEDNLDAWLSGFKILTQKRVESPWKEDKQRLFSRWHLLAEKR
ncbi:MAG: class I SAM-dependent methyltransferase [Proteobacteria bacterium]|nr:class I SAM-dependent methyltransferase [Pseudomonadota bacterium]